MNISGQWSRTWLSNCFVAGRLNYFRRRAGFSLGRAVCIDQELTGDGWGSRPEMCEHDRYRGMRGTMDSPSRVARTISFRCCFILKIYNPAGRLKYLADEQYVKVCSRREKNVDSCRRGARRVTSSPRVRVPRVPVCCTHTN